MSKIYSYYHVSNSVQLRIVLLVAALVFAYFDTFISLVKTWSGRNDYSHGFIVPFASIYYVYAMRDKLMTIDINSSITLGMAVTLVGVLMLMLGKTGGMITIQQLSLIVVLPGLVMLLLGTAMLRALLLPLGYLVLMVPLLLDVVLTPLHWPFQIFGANIAAMILSTFGVPVFQSAQYIELPNLPLEVANACSGIRYLVSIMALAIPLAYLTLDTWSKRMFLVCSSLLIGILANPIRIALIGILAYNGGSIVHGPGHILQGYFVSVVGFGFLFSTAWVMSRKQVTRKSGKGDKPGQERDDLVVGEKNSGLVERDIRAWNSFHRMRVVLISRNAWACAISSVLAVGVFVNIYSPVPVHMRDYRDKFPMELKGWKGTVIDNMAGGIVTLPKPDMVIGVAYRGPSNETLYFQVGYYEYQRQDKEFIHHTLQRLYDGAKTISVEVAPGQYISAKQVLIRSLGENRLVTYWYDIDGYMTSNNIKAKLITALQGLLKWRTSGSIVLIAGDLNATDSEEIIAGQQKMFISEIYPLLREHINSHR